MDDPRNTDQAWMETTAVNFHDDTGDLVGQLNLHAGQYQPFVSTPSFLLWNLAFPRANACRLIHETSASIVRSIAGDDAVGVKWQDMSSELELYASHKEFVYNTAMMRKAHW